MAWGNVRYTPCNILDIPQQNPLKYGFSGIEIQTYTYRVCLVVTMNVVRIEFCVKTCYFQNYLNPLLNIYYVKHMIAIRHNEKTISTLVKQNIV